ncbi:Na+/H+ antiporter subunit C [Agriterribacter sp.]|uniref:Na+/H+ antiporter subunit C n=1 Tax=Agriterribacter sp. TaxID=2821509 RepID=UPI002BB6865C|nr:Na+/H+ antiporter subunit C [Agriterribacter sp.]HRP55018.1 Na+/H+ antiporter subunit C [Agriterribacter sp.]
MELLLVILIGVLYAAGIYLMFRRSLVRLLLGLILLGNGANLLIFLMGDIAKGKPPIIEVGASVFTDVYADPVPQALILTAIVISFGLQSFAIILLKRVYLLTGSDDLDTLNTHDKDI